MNKIFIIPCIIIVVLLGIITFKFSPYSITNQTNTRTIRNRQTTEYVSQHINPEIQTIGKASFNKRHNRLIFHSYQKNNKPFRLITKKECNEIRSNTSNKHIKSELVKD